MLTLLVMAAQAAIAALAQPAATPATPPAETQKVENTLSQPSEAAKDIAAEAARELLGKLETGDEGIDQIRADIWYDRTFDLEGDRQIRSGELFFDRVRIIPQSTAGAKPEDAKVVRRFAVRFDSLLVGTRQKNEPRIHVFDGRYYADKNPDQKRMTRREVVAPGESFDPLKLGEGPLPIPIGQKRDEILKRYEARVVGVEEGLTEDTLKSFVKDATQLKLVPKAEYERSDPFREIRLWYREEAGVGGKPSRLLPRMAMTKNRNGDVSIVHLLNVKVNKDATIDASLMSTDAPEGWDVISTSFREHAPTPPPPTTTAPTTPPADASTPPASASGEKKDEKPAESPK